MKKPPATTIPSLAQGSETNLALTELSKLWNRMELAPTTMNATTIAKDKVAQTRVLKPKQTTTANNIPTLGLPVTHSNNDLNDKPQHGYNLRPQTIRKRKRSLPTTTPFGTLNHIYDEKRKIV